MGHEVLLMPPAYTKPISSPSSLPSPIKTRSGGPSFERFALALVAGSLVLVPVFLMVHPPYSEIARDMFIPQLPKEGKLSEVMLLVIAIDT
jgi:Mn2+/Fe2+ NRAMP family transporter